MMLISVSSSNLMRGILLLTALLTRSDAFVTRSYSSSVNNHVALPWNNPMDRQIKLSISRARSQQQQQRRQVEYKDHSVTTALMAQSQQSAGQSKTMSKKILGSSMAFLTGWSDIALFTKYKGFATMMSGNTIWMALAVIESRYKDVAYYASLIACYCAGVGSFRRSDLTLKSKSLTLVCAPIAMAFFIGSDILSSCVGGRWLPMMLLATGFGVINSVGAEVAGSLTFVITGHLTRLTNMFVDRVSRTAGRKKLDKEARDMNLSIFGSFFMGAFTACAIAASAKRGERLGSWLWKYTFSIVGVLYGLLFLRQDRETIGGWWCRINGAMCDLDDDGQNCELPNIQEEQGSAAATSSS